MSTQRFAKALMNVGAFHTCRHEYDELMKAAHKVRSRSEAHRRRLSMWVGLSTRKARQLQPGAILHRLWDDDFWRRPYSLIPATVRFLNGNTENHGHKMYQYITVEDVQPDHWGKRRQYQFPLHRFCDSALYEALRAEGIDVSQPNMRPPKEAEQK